MAKQAQQSWKKLWQTFHTAIKLPQHQRQAWISSHADLTEAEMSELSSLLAAHAAADNVLDYLPDKIIPAPQAGEIIDVWKVLKQIGRGGGGRVYLAERCDGAFQRQVALKVFSPLCAGADLQAAFIRERQILAALDHRGIARLLDAGTSSQGFLYLVMEYVSGVPLLQFCRDSWCEPEQRLQLFEQICTAVAYAHRKLVAHGDLKPGNIMVELADDGSARHIKLLDFGISRLLVSEPLQDRTHASMSFTPAYAAPEQWQGHALSVAADIFSLGVILYELLSGRTPFAESAHDRETFLAAVRQGPAPLAQLKRDERSKLAQHGAKLPRELDWISACCLRFEPEARYPGMQPLLYDLRALREHYPVSVAPVSASYRIGKFARRHWHWLSAAATALLVITLLMTMLVVANRTTARALQRSELFRVHAESTVDFLTDLFDLSDRTRQAGELPNASEILAKSRQQLQQHSDLGAAVRYPLLSALATVYSNLGDHQTALELAQESLTLVQIAGNPEQLLTAQMQLGKIQFLAGKLTQSKVTLSRSIDAMNAHSRTAFPAQQRIRLHLALGTTLQHLGDLPAAGEHFQHAAELSRNTAAVPALDRADVLLRLGSWHWSSGDLAAAEGYYAAAIDAHTQLPQRNLPELARAVDAHAASLYALGRYPAAAEEYRQAISMRRQVLGNEHRFTADSLSNLGAVWYEMGHDTGAETALREALSIYHKVLDDEHVAIGKTLNNLGLVRLRQGDADEAETLFRQALAIHTTALGSKHLKVAGNLNNLGLVAEQRGDWNTAVGYFQQALAIQRQALGDEHPALAHAQTNLGRIALYQQQRQRAATLFQQAYTLRLEKLGAEHTALASTLFWWGLANCHWGDAIPALEQLRHSYRIREQRLGQQHPDSIAARGALAVCTMLYSNHDSNIANELRHWQTLQLHYAATHPLHRMLAEMLTQQQSAPAAIKN